MVELFANSGDPDQMPHSVASDLGLHCLPVILLGVFSLIGLMSFRKILFNYFEMSKIMAPLIALLKSLNIFNFN